MTTRVRRIIDQYIVSFKRRHSGRLINVCVDARNECEASRKAQEYMQEHRKYHDMGYQEYGISPSTTVEAAVGSWSRDGYRILWYPTVLRRGKLKLIEAYWMYPGAP